MSGPNFTQNFCADPQKLDAHQEHGFCQPGFAHSRYWWGQEQEALHEELISLRSLTQTQLGRIRGLEQALDQSLTSLSELRQHVRDQHLLEAQLASTEDISNIQQQALAQLRQQLAQQQQSLQTQSSELQVRDQSARELLEAMEGLAQIQQTELQRLRAQMTHDRRKIRVYQEQLEKQLSDLQTVLKQQQEQVAQVDAERLSAQVLTARLDGWLEQAQRHVRDLSLQAGAGVAAPLDRSSSGFHSLEGSLHAAQAAVQELYQLLRRNQQMGDRATASGVPHAPLSTQPSRSKAMLPSGDQALGVTQKKITALEAQVARQLTTQAMLQHACQELEGTRDRQELRIHALEQQTADMQEQILRQAQQASEYETAVQHWKDRYLISRDQMVHLKELLERVLPSPPVEVLEILSTLQKAAPTIAEPSLPGLLAAPALVERGLQLDLPEFLMRRRSYKTRRS